MKNLCTLVVFTLLVSGCAGMQLKKEYKEKRGYSDSDIDLIMNQAGDYQKIINRGHVSSNAFNSAPETEANTRVRSIFCTCVKKLGNRCQSKSDGLTPDEKIIWVKGNAAEMAPMINATAWESDVHYDPAECN